MRKNAVIVVINNYLESQSVFPYMPLRSNDNCLAYITTLKFMTYFGHCMVNMVKTLSKVRV